MIPEHNDCIVSVAEIVEGEHGIEPSFLASDEALTAFAQILEMSDEEVSSLLALVPSQEVPIDRLDVLQPIVQPLTESLF